MFGRRADGRRLDNLDPTVLFMPLIMKTRNDASNLITEYVDYEPLAEYIRKRSKEGAKVSFMGLVVAAYVRAVAEHPAMNRFIMNGQIFARNQITVSLTALRNGEDRDNLDEALVKFNFKPESTIDEVIAEMEPKVKEAMDASAENGTVDFAAKFVKHRVLCKLIVAAASLLDRYGLLPKALYDISPFHCSMYITNMASIGMPALYHHLYNFGNVSMFIALGKFERQAVQTRDGVTTKLVIPLCVTTDERICGGAAYSQGFAAFKHYMTHPEELEKRPEKVVTEIPMKN